MCLLLHFLKKKHKNKFSLVHFLIDLLNEVDIISILNFCYYDLHAFYSDRYLYYRLAKDALIKQSPSYKIHKTGSLIYLFLIFGSR